MFGIEPKFPYVLGADGAGTIAAVGGKVSRFRLGAWDSRRRGEDGFMIWVTAIG